MTDAAGVFVASRARKRRADRRLAPYLTHVPTVPRVAPPDPEPARASVSSRLRVSGQAPARRTGAGARSIRRAARAGWWIFARLPSLITGAIAAMCCVVKGELDAELRDGRTHAEARHELPGLRFRRRRAPLVDGNRRTLFIGLSGRPLSFTSPPRAHRRRRRHSCSPCVSDQASGLPFEGSTSSLTACPAWSSSTECASPRA